MKNPCNSGEIKRGKNGMPNEEEDIIRKALDTMLRSCFKPQMTATLKDGTKFSATFDTIEDLKNFTAFIEELFNGMKNKAIEEAKAYGKTKQ
jgi:hypothetical protein